MSINKEIDEVEERIFMLYMNDRWAADDYVYIKRLEDRLEKLKSIRGEAGE